MEAVPLDRGHGTHRSDPLVGRATERATIDALLGWTRALGLPAMADLQRRVTKSGEVRWDVRYRDDARQQRKHSLAIGGRAFLLTTGYQANRKTYKGSHIPVPLDLVLDGKADAEQAAGEDVMSLTKLNWNSAADHVQFPVTLAFAQKVETIMAEFAGDEELQTRFSYI